MKVIFPTKDLLEALGSQDFLRVLYKKNKENSSNFSFNFIAQKCGFSSKSFLKEVIDGKKKLSLESAYKITTGLNFPSLWAQYFTELIKSENEKLELKPKHQKERLRLKSKLSHKAYEKEQDLGNILFQKLQHWPYIYAALGESESGATSLEIEKRTGFSETTIKSTMEILLVEKLVALRGRRYYATSSTVFFEKLGDSEFFKDFFCRTILKSQELASRRFGSEDALFYSMALSLKADQMPNFRQELSELLDKYTSEIEDPKGSRVASLSCAFHLI